MARVTQAELARHLGVTPQAVSKAVKCGRLALGDDGRMDLATAESQWKGEATQPRTGSPVGDAPDYFEARARKEHEQARLAKLKADELEGRLVDLEDVKATWFVILRTLRDRLLGVPDRLATLAASESDAHEVRLMIDREIRAALESAPEDAPPGEPRRG